MPRALARLRFAASTMLVAAGAATSLGCGALSAAANPKVAWALNEPTPMPVIVRRAEAARMTSVHVDRLLTRTPVSSGSDWLEATSPAPDLTQKLLAEFQKMDVYSKSSARVVAAEVWVKALSVIDAKAGDRPNLLATIDEEVATAYEPLALEKHRIAKLKGDVAILEAQAGAEGTSDAEKERLAARIERIEATVEGYELDLAPKLDAFVDMVRARAKAAPRDVANDVGKALANLRVAVDDARTANGAALVRYPMALPGLKQDFQDLVPRLLTEVVAEKTGKQPTLGKLQVGVTFEGGEPAVTINGLTANDLGALEVDVVVKETIDRTLAFAKQVLMLPATCSSTEETLGMEDDVLEALMGGLEESGWTLPEMTALITVQ